MLWWHWLVLGLILGLCELAIPAFFLIWLGIAALVVGILTAILPIGLSTQIVLWAMFSIALVVLWQRVFKQNLHRSQAGMASSVLGEVGILVSDVEPFQPGQVRFQKPVLGADVWECVAETAVRAGARVKIVAVEGKVVRVAATVSKSEDAFMT